MKHVRQIIQGIKALHPDIKVETLRQKTHIIIEVTLGDRKKHLSLPTSPRNRDLAVTISVAEAKRFFL